MKLQKRKPSGREKNEASIKPLEQLREKLYSDVSTARRAAFKLSWMQEDGLDILKETLFSNSPRSRKTAAAYGLRSMRGRMKKPALEVLKQGQANADRNIREVCRNALSLVSAKAQEKSHPEPAAEVGKFEIREISRKSGQKRKVHKKAGKRTPSAG